MNYNALKSRLELVPPHLHLYWKKYIAEFSNLADYRWRYVQPTDSKLMWNLRMLKVNRRNLAHGK